jgi:hypothetical protein
MQMTADFYINLLEVMTISQGLKSKLLYSQTAPGPSKLSVQYFQKYHFIEAASSPLRNAGLFES